jgi:hypothetical protein
MSIAAIVSKANLYILFCEVKMRRLEAGSKMSLQEGFGW